MEAQLEKNTGAHTELTVNSWSQSSGALETPGKYPPSPTSLHGHSSSSFLKPLTPHPHPHLSYWPCFLPDCGNEAQERRSTDFHPITSPASIWTMAPAFSLATPVSQQALSKATSPLRYQLLSLPPTQGYSSYNSPFLVHQPFLLRWILPISE